jgi:hypothetical protein
MLVSLRYFTEIIDLVIEVEKRPIHFPHISKLILLCFILGFLFKSLSQHDFWLVSVGADFALQIIKAVESFGWIDGLLFVRTALFL